MNQKTATTPDRAPIERFRRVLLVNIAVLAMVEVGVVLSGLWLGFSWFVVGLMVLIAVSAAYLVYLVRRFTSAP